jgi:hypothetical protein
VRGEESFITLRLYEVKNARYPKSGDRNSRVSLMKGNVEIFLGIAAQISMTTVGKEKKKML